MTSKIEKWSFFVISLAKKSDTVVLFPSVVVLIWLKSMN